MRIICGPDLSTHARGAANAAVARTARLQGTLSPVHVMDASHYELTSKATNLIGGLTREKTLAQQTAFEIGRGEQANVSAAHQALIHRAQCKQAARHSEFTATREEK